MAWCICTAILIMSLLIARLFLPFRNRWFGNISRRACNSVLPPLFVSAVPEIPAVNISSRNTPRKSLMIQRERFVRQLSEGCLLSFLLEVTLMLICRRSKSAIKFVQKGRIIFPVERFRQFIRQTDEGLLEVTEEG